MMRRREYLKYAGAAGLGLAVGAIAGYIGAPPKIIEVKPTHEVPKEPIKIAYVCYQTGPFSSPGRYMGDAAKLVVDEINTNGGILGRRIDLTMIDEAIGADRLTTEGTRLYGEGYDAIIGVNGSSNELALTKVAEDVGGLLIIDNGGSMRAFVEKPYKYTFRTATLDWHIAIADGFAILEAVPDVKTIATVNEDYSWGRDTAKYCLGVIQKLKPDVEVVYQGWPAIGSTDFTPHIAALAANPPDVVYSTMWGNDLITFINQAKLHDLFQKSKFFFLCSSEAYVPLGKEFPENVWVGSTCMGACSGFRFPPRLVAPLNEEFQQKFVSRYGVYPYANCFGTRDAFYFFKYAVEKASAIRGGGWPEIDEIIKAGEGMAFESTAGVVKIRPDHVFCTNALWGRSVHTGKPIIEAIDVVVVPPERYIPAPGVTVDEFINQL